MSDERYPPIAAEEWLNVSGEVLRAIVHALNNRIASVEGMGATLEDNEDLGKLGARMASEGERLRELTEGIRLLCDESAGAEASTLADLVAAASLLASLHPDLRDARIDVRGVEAMPALRVRQRRTVHAIVLALLASAAGGAGDVIVLCTEASDERVQMLMRPLRPASGSEEGASSRAAAANALLQIDGGSADLQLRAGSRAVVVSVPSLTGARRAERAAAS